MDGLRSSNEIRQAEAAADLAEMLLLGNEESLPNLPIKEIVSVLILLLQKEHNFELVSQFYFIFLLFDNPKIRILMEINNEINQICSIRFIHLLRF